MRRALGPSHAQGMERQLPEVGLFATTTSVLEELCAGKQGRVYSSRVSRVSVTSASPDVGLLERLASHGSRLTAGWQSELQELSLWLP